MNLTRLKSRVLFSLTLALLFWGGSVLRAAPTSPDPVMNDGSPWGPFHTQQGPLSVRAINEQRLGKNSVSVIVSNKSNDFMCISAKILDSVYQHISLKDANGNRVPLLRYGESGPDTLLQFNYLDSYVFILPEETREVEIDIGNFRAPPGRYHYDIIGLYFRCRDVIDLARLSKKRNIMPFGFHADGVLVLPTEK